LHLISNPDIINGSPCPGYDFGAITRANGFSPEGGGVKMRDYEMMFIIKPDLSDENIAEIKEKLHNIIADFGGEFENEVPGWGKKRMAYRIEDYSEGIYVLWNFKGKPETVAELDRVIKISDSLLRHIIIRKDEK